MIYTVEEVSKILRVSAATVRKMIKQGKLEAFYVGSQARITKEALDRYIKTSM
jgi:excisionase family DNA binding protein